VRWVVRVFYRAQRGEAYFHGKAGERGKAIRHWVEQNGFGSVGGGDAASADAIQVVVFAAGVFEFRC